VQVKLANRLCEAVGAEFSAYFLLARFDRRVLIRAKSNDFTKLKQQ
jgi:hypothetical protein